MLIALLAPLVAACGAGASPTPNRGTVSVLYAGSLVNLMEHDLGPAFARATGYTYQGVGAGSTALVAQIKSNVRQGDVFISASPAANQGLEGVANGDHVSWYATFAQAPLVLGYNPSSPFAAAFRSAHWYDVVTRQGIRIGRTDPALDPKGTLTVTAMNQAATDLSMPSLVSAMSRFAVFPEETLVGRLETGQLDAGFFYSNEAAEQHIPTVSLAPGSLSATYTVTVLNGALHPAGAEAFVSYLLGASGRSTLTRHGLILLMPALSGPASAVPSGVRPLVSPG